MTSANANTLSSDIVALAPAPSAPPPSLAMVSRQMGDSKPPQAIVKPQILTHIIEGFVIQEGAEPFPVRAGPEGGAFTWGLGLVGCLFRLQRLRRLRTISLLENGSVLLFAGLAMEGGEEKKKDYVDQELKIVGRGEAKEKSDL